VAKAKQAKGDLVEAFLIVSDTGAPTIKLGPGDWRTAPCIQLLPFAGADEHGRARGQIELTRGLWNKWFADKNAALWDACDTFDKLLDWLLKKGYRLGCPICNTVFTARKEQQVHYNRHRQALAGALATTEPLYSGSTTEE